MNASKGIVLRGTLRTFPTQGKVGIAVAVTFKDFVVLSAIYSCCVQPRDQYVCDTTSFIHRAEAACVKRMKMSAILAAECAWCISNQAFMHAKGQG